MQGNTTLENPKGAIKNGQSREIGNIYIVFLYISLNLYKQKNHREFLNVWKYYKY